MRKGRPMFGQHTALFQPADQAMIRESVAMVLFIPVLLKTLFVQGRNYTWPRPADCPRCRSATVWGHGFAEALFDGYNRPLLLKLYRCPDCGCVIRLRPEGYFKRFQAPIKTIRASILCRSKNNQWLAGLDRCRQAHWFRALKRKITAYLTDTWRNGIMAGFDYLMQLGQIPVSRSI